MELSKTLSYYFESLTRTEATQILEREKCGSFLLRKRIQSTEEESYAISLLFNNKVYHYNISKCEETGLYYMENGSRHRSLATLCKHYMNHKGGLKSKLFHPILNVNTRNQRPLHFSCNVGNSTYMNYEECDWFHGNITRSEATSRLTSAFLQLNKNGIFLIRLKSNKEFVLSLINDGNVHRYKIVDNQENKMLWMSDRMPEFETLIELVQFMLYNDKNITGLACHLTIPCPQNMCAEKANTTARDYFDDASLSRKVKNIASSLASQFKFQFTNSNTTENDECSDDASSNTDTGIENLEIDSQSKSFHIKDFLKLFSRKSLPKDSIGFTRPKHLESDQDLAKHLYIKRRNLRENGILGRGHFGVVKLGQWCTFSGYVVDCAIKSISGPNMDRNKVELLNEAKLMQKLDNPFIVRMLGICDDRHGFLLILELAPLGSIKCFLKDKNADNFPEEKIVLLLGQVCEGMAYLSENNVVHRDLAARNILLVSEKYAKISDFGLSRVLCDNEDFYSMSTPRPVPMRWYAPELFVERKFTSKADVWSFGVTVWECISYNDRPYKDQHRSELAEVIKSGKQLERPHGCSDKIYHVMSQCWIFEPHKRPSFIDLLELFY